MSFNPLLPWVPYAIVVLLVLGGVAWAAYQDLKISGGARSARLTWIRRGLIAVLVAFIGFGPSTTVTTTELARANVDVYFVVDRTGSMAAEDYGPDAEPRLKGVRHDMREIIKDLSGGRFSIISFDSAASRQMPLTTDSTALKTWIGSLNQEITLYSSGSSLNRVYGELEQALRRGAEENPQNQRIVYILTDGENTSEDSRQSFAGIKQYINGGAVLGYGTAEGGKMKRYDPILSSESEEYIQDFTQSPVVPAISKIDEVALGALAQEMGIKYIHRAEPTDMKEATSGIDPKLVAAEGRRTTEIQQLLIWPFAALLAGLLVWEFAAATYRTTRKVG